MLIGAVLGFLCDELVKQLRSDRNIRTYLENPGKSEFYEPSPGLGAYCALLVLILSLSVHREGKKGQRFSDNETALLKAATSNAVRCFYCSEKETYLIESFCRQSLYSLDKLNPDLLYESLAARRKSCGDLKRITACLVNTANGKEAEQLVYRIQSLISPVLQPNRTKAWQILGLDPQADTEQIKQTFRKLAVQFHPDVLSNLDADKRQHAHEAFLKIREAYREVMHERSNAQSYD